jgi:hypothetical protein
MLYVGLSQFDNELLFCNCMRGFSIRSPKDWELDDQTSGCMRNTPLDCVSNKSTGSSTDKFYSIPCVRLPSNAYNIEAATSEDICGTVCLNNCSCTAYSYGNGGCLVWHNELLNVKQQCNDVIDTGGGTLYLRLSAKEVQNQKSGARRTMISIGLAVSFAILFSLALVLMIWWNKRKRHSFIWNNAQGGNGIVPFRYTDLQHATKNFSEKLGEGGFGPVFKGSLCESTTIAVKRLDGAYQGEKQFRAEVSSIGLVQHINLIKLIGFCSSSNSKLLVYEYMPHRSLDIHLFAGDAQILNWSTRYQIALGIARGLVYLHESCRDCIIHCDVKPQNILLDESFTPKIADFGMAKLLGRNFSRALTTIRGTIGYLAPEWISGGAITPKVDVYSYGMLLFEIVSGRRNSHIEHNDDTYFPVQVASKLLVRDVGGLVDHKLQGDFNLKEAERACKVACWCIQDNETDRPTMGEVVQILEGLIELDIPPMPRLLQAIAGGSHSA